MLYILKAPAAPYVKRPLPFAHRAIPAASVAANGSEGEGGAGPLFHGSSGAWKTQRFALPTPSGHATALRNPRGRRQRFSPTGTSRGRGRGASLCLDPRGHGTVSARALLEVRSEGLSRRGHSRLTFAEGRPQRGRKVLQKVSGKPKPVSLLAREPRPAPSPRTRRTAPRKGPLPRSPAGSRSPAGHSRDSTSPSPTAGPPEPLGGKTRGEGGQEIGVGVGRDPPPTLISSAPPKLLQRGKRSGAAWGASGWTRWGREKDGP